MRANTSLVSCLREKASNSFLFGLPRHRISRKRVGRMENEVLHGHRDMQHRKNDAKTTDSTSRAVGPLSKGCRLQRDSDTKPVAALVALTGGISGGP